jgi:hypothetical protein
MAQRYDITIDQGSPFQLEVDLFDSNMNVDESIYTGAGKMKKHYTSSNAYSFDVSVANGKVEVSMTSTYTANLVPGRYVYDVEIYNNDDEANPFALRVVEGVATVTPSVTD